MKSLVKSNLTDARKNEEVLVEALNEDKVTVLRPVRVESTNVIKSKIACFDLQSQIKVKLPMTMTCYRDEETVKNPHLRIADSSGGGKIKYIDSQEYLEGEMEKKDRANCVPRAIAMATGKTYKEAYDFCADKLGRKHGRGTNIQPIMNGKIKSILGKKVKAIKSPNAEKVTIVNGKQPKNVYIEYGETVVRNMTVKSFISHFPKGTFLVAVDKHAFCITDGFIKGNPKDAQQMRRIVLEVVQLA